MQYKKGGFFVMLNKILTEVCNQMASDLDKAQLDKLKNVLYINFHDKVLVEEKYEIIPAETDEDLEMIKMFVASKRISGRAETTLKQYVEEIRYCRNAIGKSFRNITTMDLRWYLGKMQESRKNKMSTINNKIKYLNSFYTFLVNEQILTYNPVTKIERPKIEHEILRAFSIFEMESIRKQCENVRDRMIVEFLYATGLRVSELVSLNIGDIDMAKKEFSVIGKGNKERIVYFSDTAYFHLKEYLEWRLNVEGKPIELLMDRPLIVSTKKPYDRMEKSGIEALCRKMGKGAGVDDVHPHRFRRTFATEMASKGMKIEELAKLMGHAKLETTLIYCNIKQENVRNSYYKYCA